MHSEPSKIDIGKLGHPEPGALGDRLERLIVCGSPETSVVRRWRPTIQSVSDENVFWYGDNLDVMRDHIADNSVDLIYLDPPFNSQQVYNRFFGEVDGAPSDAQRRAFEDYWKWGREASAAYDEVLHPRTRRYAVPAALSQTLEMFRGILRESNLLAYLSMMAVRLVEMRRILKPSGSLYLHCDPTASHYLKLILDALFGAEQFRSEAIWKRMSAHNSALRYGPVHDTILFYTRSDEYTWNEERHERDLSKTRHDLYKLADGRTVKTEDLTGTGTRNGRSGVPWRGFDPNENGRHWRCTVEKLDILDGDGKIYWPSEEGKWPRLITAIIEGQGTKLQDVWTDIDQINSGSRERVGYPTQKPVALLERIIKASSKAGDLVLDPFCGCGTAVVASERLKRKWIGIDVTHVAVSVLKQRLEREFPGLVYRVRGEPDDVASARRLAEEKWEEFQAWIVDKVGGIPLNPTDEKKVAQKGKDGGVDGFFLFRDDPKAERSKRMILSVKAGKSLAPEMIDALHGVVTRTGAAAGALLTAYPVTPGMKKTALAYGYYESELFAPGKKYPKIQVVSVEDIFDSRWRGLEYPGSNTSRRSEPPAPLGQESDLKPKGPRKASTRPPEAERAAASGERFALKPPEPKKAKPKQQKLGLKAPGARGKR